MKLQALVVDDSLMYQLLLKKMLQKHGFGVHTVGSGHEAYETVQNNPEYDLLILDMELEGASGLETYVTIRKKLQVDIPAIAITGHADQVFVKKLKANGFQGHVKKPPGEEALMDQLRQISGIKEYLPGRDEPPEQVYEADCPQNRDNDMIREMNCLLDEAEKSGTIIYYYTYREEWNKLVEYTRQLNNQLTRLGKPALCKDLMLMEQYAQNEESRDKLNKILQRYQSRVKDLVPQMRQQYSL